MAADLAFQSSNGLVVMSGELDSSSRDHAFDACCSSTGFAVVLDLSDVTFMDSGGLVAIVDAARVLRSEGRSLTIRGLRGQPLRLVTLIGAPADIEFTQPMKARRRRSIADGTRQ
jgi:anti-anti-sigma factor